MHGGTKARETSVAALGRQLRSICQFAVIKNDEELEMLTAVAAACLLATSSMSSALAEKKNRFNIARFARQPLRATHRPNHALLRWPEIADVARAGICIRADPVSIRLKP